MDIQEQERFTEIARQNSINAGKYAEAREQAAKVKYELDMLLGARYLDKSIERSMAYEKALVLIANESEANKSLYQQFLKYPSIFKGLERVIEANADQIRFSQSRMKYEKDNT